MFRILSLSILLSLACCSIAQTANPAPPDPSPAAISLTLDQAIKLAKQNAPQFRSALADAGIAREDRVQARAAMLPGVSFTTGTVYTEPNGTSTGSYVSANSVHEYIAQGVVHEGLSFSSVADYRRAHWAEIVAKAKAEVALRGIVATVVQDFYGAIAAQKKFANAQLAADEALRFVDLSQKLENGGEVAHSDVIKAQLQSNDRQRDVQDAQLAGEKAKLDLAVLVFPKFTQDFQLVDDSAQIPELPQIDRVRELAGKNNPDIKAAEAAASAAQSDVTSAFGAHLPALSLNYFYGIDAPNFATYSDGVRNLGYQVSATLDIPIFDWGATQSKVKQAQLRRDQAKVELSAAQRQALANLQEFFNEGQTARAQLDLLNQSADLAAESLRLTTLRYQGGEATALEVVDAQNALVQARGNLNDGTVRYRVAVANLQTLTGSF